MDANDRSATASTEVFEATPTLDVSIWRSFTGQTTPTLRHGFDEVRLEVRRRRTSDVLARAVLRAPEKLAKPEPADADPASLGTGAFVASCELASDAPAAAVALLAYSILRQARIFRRTTVYAASGTLDDRLATLWGVRPLRAAAPSTHAGVRVDMGMFRAAAALTRAGEPLQAGFLAREVVDAVFEFVARIYQTGFFRAVEAGTLTREQYVYMLGQTHQYVRYTTRILGRCVAHSDSTELRQHFIKHLTGEINHEQIIERDLSHLGEDPTFVRDHMGPNGPTAQFTLAELALISHFQDPYLLTAAPLAAEGMSAHLSPAWIERLNGIVGSWGVARPDQATRFLTSHIDFDSGDDGHWEGSVQMLSRYLTDEQRLARFVGALSACTDALERCYGAAVEDMALWR